MSDVDVKIDRVAKLARERGLAAVLVTRQSNFAWLTDGQSNRIDGSVEAGAGSLLLTAQGGRYVIANHIEMPRLTNEALRGLSFEPIDYPWVDDQTDRNTPLRIAHRLVGGDVGSDIAIDGATLIERDLTARHVPLTDAELKRYRTLGRDVASAVEQLCRALRPGLSECAVAGEVNSVVSVVGARPIVTLVAADDRLAAFRHPVPTVRAWERTLLIGLCAERQGLVVALSRIISTKPDAIRALTRATTTVFSQLLAATRPGVTGGELYATAAHAYRSVGYEGQEQLHHQGGAIGYRSRDWIAHPTSCDVVFDRQAFAWNPSITGTKVEDTALLADGQIELITATGDWPAILEV
jgi:Xaa-Pro aminopeptidase